MKLNRLLLLIFVIVLLFRLAFVFQTPTFSSDESYFHLRQIEHIIKTGLPLFYDPSSYGGRDVVYPPLFHYIMVPFYFIPYALKFVPALLFSFLVIISYLISKEISKNKLTNLLIALSVGFIPVIIEHTLNKLSSYSIALPLILLMIYCLMKLEKSKKFLYLFIICSILLPLTHPSAFLFILTLLFYLIFVNTESIILPKIKKEAIMFSFFITFLLSFIIFKKALATHGIAIIWQNIPEDILSDYFKVNLFNGLSKLGILFFILGGIELTRNIFKEKRDDLNLITSIILSIFLLLLLKLINIQVGLMFLGIGFTLLSTPLLSKIINYIQLTKFVKYNKLFIVLIILLIFASSILPSVIIANSIIKSSPTIDGVAELKQLEESEDITILGSLEEGNLISYTTGKKNLIDTNFLLAPETTQRYEDMKYLYTGWSKLIAIDKLHKYNIGYIYISDNTKKLYNITKPPYIEDENCFQKKQSLYRVLC